MHGVQGGQWELCYQHSDTLQHVRQEIGRHETAEPVTDKNGVSQVHPYEC